MIVKVTSKHITAAKKSVKKSAVQGCMVAVALNSKRNITEAQVGFFSVGYRTKNGWVETQLPESVSKNIRKFCSWISGNAKRPKPFQFEIPDAN